MKATKYNQYWTQLEFESDKERSVVEKAVSFEVKGAEFSASYLSGHWDGKKSFLTPANKIPSGLFKHLFPEHPLFYDATINYDFDDIPLFRNNPHLDRRDYQLKAINTIFRHKRLIIKAGTGSGKTLIAAAAISKQLSLTPGKQVLFVCYDTNILGQTVKNLTNYGLNVTALGNGSKNLTGDVVVATIQSLSRLKNPGRTLSNFTFCVADESHHASARTSRDVLTKLKKCDYYIGLSATPPKDNTIELAELMSIIGPVLFNHDFTTATKAGNIVPVKCFFLKTPFDFDAKSSVLNRKNYKIIWDNGIRDNDSRNATLSKIAHALVSVLDTQILVNVDRVEHGNNIQSKLLGANLKAMEMYGEDNIIIRETKKAYLTDSHIDVLTTSVCKEGVDLKIAPAVAINATGRKSFVNIVQFLGRIVRKNERFKSFRALIDFYDTCHPKLVEHSEERMQACRDIGAEVVLVDSVKDLLHEIINHYKTTGV